MTVKFRIQDLVWWILGIVSIGGFLISVFHISNSIYYIADLLNAILLICSIKKIKQKRDIPYFNVIKMLLVLFLLANIISAIGNEVKPGLVIWGARNMFRGFLFYLSCIILLDGQHIRKFFSVLSKLFWVNFFVSVLEYVIWGLQGDYLGGVFGVEKGCNGATIIFLNIVIAYVMANYLTKKSTFIQIVPYLLTYFFLVALTETKGNYIFFVIIVVTEVVIGKKSYRTIFLMISAIIGLIIGYGLLVRYFPESAETLINITAANKYMDATYYGKETFTRNALIDVANRNFLDESLWKKTFGLGLGTCENSRFITSDFYLRYGDMNYRQYSSMMVLLQIGYVGLALFIAFFGVTAILSYKWDKISGGKYKEYFLLVIGYIPFVILFHFYGTTFIDMGYWCFFIMAIPAIMIKGRQQERLMNLSRGK